MADPVRPAVLVPESDDSRALVPLDENPEALKKRRNELIKRIAKAQPGYDHGQQPVYASYSNKATFVTGGGIPNRNRRQKYESSSSEEENIEDIED